MNKFTCEDALAFLADSDIGAGLVKPDGTFADVNTAYCHILRTPKELIIGHNFVEFTHPDDISLDVEYADRLRKGEAFSYEFVKRYIQRGSTPQKQLIIWGLLKVQAVWDKTEFKGFRVTFDPVKQEPNLNLQKVKDYISWSIKNWKKVVTVVVISASLIGIGKEQLLETLQRIQRTKQSVDSVLEPLSSSSSSQHLSLPSSSGSSEIQTK